MKKTVLLKAILTVLPVLGLLNRLVQKKIFIFLVVKKHGKMVILIFIEESLDTHLS